MRQKLSFGLVPSAYTGLPNYYHLHEAHGLLLLKGLFTPKLKFCFNLGYFMLFQTCMTFLFLSELSL